MKKVIGSTTWWLSLFLTTLGVTAILVRVILTRALPFSFVVTLCYGVIGIVALLLNRTGVSIRFRSPQVLERFISVPPPLLYCVALVQTRFRQKPDLLQ